MVSKLDTRLKAPKITLSKAEKLVFMPGNESGWEAWVFNFENIPRKLEVHVSDEDLFRYSATLFVLPIRQVFSVPLWLYGSDGGSHDAALKLQLEGMGLLGKTKSAEPMGYSEVSKEQARVLFSTGVLRSPTPPDWISANHKNYDLSARYYRFPSDQITLWKEHGRIVLAVTKGSRLVHFQDLGLESLTNLAIQNLACVKMSLDLRVAINPLSGITVWFPLTEAETARLQNELRLLVKEQQKPAPTLPEKFWNLKPIEVVELVRKKARRRWQTRGVIAVLSIYLVVIAVLITHLELTSSKLHKNQKWLDAHQSELVAIQKSQDAWSALNLSLDQDHYPLENLLRCAKAISGDDFHLTLFEQEKGDFTVQGEGKNATAAEAFAKGLQHDPAFSSYTWKVEAPTILPNDLAQIQLRAYAPTN